MAKKTDVIKTGFTAHLFAVNLVEKLVEVFKGFMTTNFLEFCIKWLSRIGHFAIIVAAGIGFLFTLIAAIRSNSFKAFLFGIAWVLIIFVAQYTAHKFLGAGEKLIKNNPTQLASKTFLDCFAFLVMIGGVIAFIMGIVNAVQYKSFQPFIWGLGMAVFLEFVALVSFNPKEITIDIVDDNSAGQEAIGIITFFIKAIMKLVPILFGVGVTIGTVMLLINMFGLFGSNWPSAYMEGNVTAMQILYAALLPFLSYLFFVLAYLGIDVIRAILSIPGKLDKK